MTGSTRPYSPFADVFLVAPVRSLKAVSFVHADEVPTATTEQAAVKYRHAWAVPPRTGGCLRRRSLRGAATAVSVLASIRPAIVHSVVAAAPNSIVALRAPRVSPEQPPLLLPPGLQRDLPRRRRPDGGSPPLFELGEGECSKYRRQVQKTVPPIPSTTADEDQCAGQDGHDPALPGNVKAECKRDAKTSKCPRGSAMLMM